MSVQRVEREKKNAKKYRGIRFIEGRKLTRKLKQLQRALKTATGKVSTALQPRLPFGLFRVASF